MTTSAHVTRWTWLAAAGATALMLGATPAAQLASRPAEEWVKVLDGPERIAGLRIDEVVARLKLRPTDVVADLGAGTGPFIVPFAKAVPKGKVYAVDIDRGFFPLIQQKAKAAGVTNVQTVLGEFTDPTLPAADVDVAFFHDVLHHVEDRQGYLKAVTRYLKPGGRIVVIDYEPAQSPHKDDTSLQVSRAQAAGWMKNAGYKVVEEVQLFPDKWFVIYGL